MSDNGTKEPITEAADIRDAIETIKAIEFMGFALEETLFKPKFFGPISKSMEILKSIHDDLVSRLPPEVIEQEKAKQNPPPKILRPDTISLGKA